MSAPGDAGRMTDLRGLLASWHAAAVAAVQGESVFADYASVSRDPTRRDSPSADEWRFSRGGRSLRLALPCAPGRLRLVGIGKAALGMARGFRRSLRSAGRDVDDGLLIVRDLPSDLPGDLPGGVRSQILRGEHPYPGEESERAAQALVSFIGEPHESDLFVVLLSGGASALCALPAPGVTLEEKRRVTRALIHAGAPIHEINRVRKQMSAIKGGRLAERMRPARIATLAISDVPGDDPDVIGSAPTWSPEIAARGDAPYTVIATLDDALDAAAVAARGTGFDIDRQGRLLDGPIDEVESRVHAWMASHLADPYRDRPRVLVAGGETLVTVRGGGRGGRAQELALRLSRRLGSASLGLSGLVAGTDGSDGPTAAAGGFFEAGAATRAQQIGIDLSAAIAQNDAMSALEALGDLFITGPTGTNVADVLLAVIPPR